MDVATIEAMIAQRVVESLSKLAKNKNVISTQGVVTVGCSTQGGYRGHPRACSYKEFMNCKP